MTGMGHQPYKRSGSRGDVEHLIATLSEHLDIPAQQVGEIYWEQLERLSADARIPDFLIILALRNARRILRARRAAGASPATHAASPAAAHRAGAAPPQATRAADTGKLRHRDTVHPHSSGTMT